MEYHPISIVAWDSSNSCLVGRRKVRICNDIVASKQKCARHSGSLLALKLGLVIVGCPWPTKCGSSTEDIVVCYMKGLKL